MDLSPDIVSRLTVIKSLLDLGDYEVAVVASKRLEGAIFEEVLSALQEHRYSEAANLIEGLLTRGRTTDSESQCVEAELVKVSGGELPRSSVIRPKSVEAFFISRTQVTWAQFQPVRYWASENGYDLQQAGSANGLQHPVNNVNWYQALKWCNARSEKEGLIPVYMLRKRVFRKGQSEPTIDATANGYRLPSEREWEFAARGGIKTNGYEYSGSNDINSVAWWHDSNNGRGTQEVATKQANELGLFDMSGNVVEWCFDYWDGGRVSRGGSCLLGAFNCRVAQRDYYSPSSSNNGSGFRVARDSVP